MVSLKLEKMVADYFLIPQELEFDLLPSPYLSIANMLEFPLPLQSSAITGCQSAQFFSKELPDLTDSDLQIRLLRLPIPDAKTIHRLLDFGPSFTDDEGPVDAAPPALGRGQRKKLVARRYLGPVRKSTSRASPSHSPKVFSSRAAVTRHQHVQLRGIFVFAGVLRKHKRRKRTEQLTGMILLHNIGSLHPGALDTLLLNPTEPFSTMVESDITLRPGERTSPSLKRLLFGQPGLSSILAARNFPDIFSAPDLNPGGKPSSILKYGFILLNIAANQYPSPREERPFRLTTAPGRAPATTACVARDGGMRASRRRGKGRERDRATTGKGLATIRGRRLREIQISSHLHRHLHEARAAVI
ncbi:hypothetical protein C8R45DRAFT_945307 [Mycena sanguinolenta]|nr:hypothetical protein C8R45DRAFT_945307 [Mycena sanguinolenta]